MHISSTGPVTSTPPTSPGKSQIVSPGLANRDPALPPGIAKKLDAGGTPPPGIAKRFPAATITPTSDMSGTETSSGTQTGNASSQDDTTSTVDLLI
jgi:hypothetical protein